MAQKKFKNNIINFFNKKFRLVVINDETLEEEGFLKISRSNILALTSIVVISVFITVHIFRSRLMFLLRCRISW